jgi:environmental stress-induced protein Ves
MHVLTAPFAPFAFPGEAKVDVELAGSATRDFNLMVRRTRGHGELQVWRGPATCMTGPATMLLFCARGEVDTAEGRLGTGAAWRPSVPASSRVTLHEGAIALAVHVEPRAA